MHTHTIVETWNGEGRTVRGECSFTGGMQTGLNEQIPKGAKDVKMLIALYLGALESLIIFATADATIKTNSASKPGDTLKMRAGVAYVWNKKKLDALRLKADVTQIFVTSKDEGNLQIEALHNPTSP